MLRMLHPSRWRSLSERITASSPPGATCSSARTARPFWIPSRAVSMVSSTRQASRAGKGKSGPTPCTSGRWTSMSRGPGTWPLQPCVACRHRRTSSCQGSFLAPFETLARARWSTLAVERPSAGCLVLRRTRPQSMRFWDLQGPGLGISPRCVSTWWLPVCLSPSPTHAVTLYLIVSRCDRNPFGGSDCRECASWRPQRHRGQGSDCVDTQRQDGVCNRRRRRHCVSSLGLFQLHHWAVLAGQWRQLLRSWRTSQKR